MNEAGGLRFGFVPNDIVAALHDIGNWKSRATAIDSLQACLYGIHHKSQLLAGLPDFVAFLNQLIADPNFKISVSSMDILAQLVMKVGSDISSQLRATVPQVQEKLADAKVIVRSAAMKVLHRLMVATGTRTVLELLKDRWHSCSTRTREEVVNATIVALLTFPSMQLDYPQIGGILTLAMSDKRDKVFSIGVEGAAVVHSKLGTAQFQKWLSSLSPSADMQAAIQQRIQSPQLPTINADGMVEHVTEAPAAQVPASAAHTGSSGWVSPSSITDSNAAAPASQKLPWEVPRPRSRTRSTSTLPTERVLDPQQDDGYSAAFSRHQENGGQPAEGAHRSPVRHLVSKNPLDFIPDVQPVQPIGLRNNSTQPYFEQGPATFITSISAPSVPSVAPTVQPRALRGQGTITSHSQLIQDLFSSHRSDIHSSPALLQPPNTSNSTSSAPQAPPKHTSGTSQAQMSVWLPSTEDPCLGTGGCDSPKQHASPTTRKQAMDRLRNSCDSATSGSTLVSSSVDDWRIRTECSEDQPPLPDGHPAALMEPRETWSPSKQNRLEFLKKRQQEKRAATAPREGIGAMTIPDMFSSASLDSPDRGLFFDKDIQSPTQELSPASRFTPVTADTTRYHEDDYSEASGFCHSPIARYPPPPEPAPRHPAPYQQGFDEQLRSGREPQQGEPGASVSRQAASAASSICAPSSPVQSSPSPVQRTADPASPVTPNSLSRVRSRPGSNGDPLSTPSTPGSTSSRSNSFWEKGPKVEELGTQDLQPLPDPEGAIRRVIQRLQVANAANHKELDWQDQYDALNDARRIVMHHVDALRPFLHEFVLAVIPAIDQLRSFTSRNALMLVQELFTTLGRGMERELDELVPALLKKAGEVSTAGRENFLASEADAALFKMVANISETRAISSLLACAGHKSNFVRQKTAAHLDAVLEVAASRSGFSTNQSILEKLFKQAALFLDEGALETRTYGKRLIWSVRQCLGGRSEVERLMASMQPALQRKVYDVLDNSNGPPPPPVKSTGGSRLGSRQSSQPASPSTPSRSGEILIDRAPSLGASSGGAGAANDVTRIGSRTMRTPGATGTPAVEPRFNRRTSTQDCSTAHTDMDNVQPGRLSRSSSKNNRPKPFTGSDESSQAQDAAEAAMQRLMGKTWTERLEGLKGIEALQGSLGYLPDGTIGQLMDCIITRASDGNSKVATQALEVLAPTLAQLQDRVAYSLNSLVPALSSGMASTNPNIRMLSSAATDALIASCDPPLLLQTFSHCIANGNARAKPPLVEKYCAIVYRAYPAKPQLVSKYAVPAAFALLPDAKGEVKIAAQQLLCTLADLMGPALLETSASLSTANQSKLVELLGFGGSARRA